MESNNDFETALEDITAACILERFANHNSLYTADKVLKQLGKLIYYVTCIIYCVCNSIYDYQDTITFNFFK